MIQGQMITIGGGLIQSGSADLGTKTITANGTYTASTESLDGYSEVTVNVSGGGSTLVSKSITANGNYDPADDSADGYSAVAVNVPNSYSASDEGKVVSSGALVAQTSTTVTANGTYDTTTNDEVVVNVSGGSSFATARVICQSGTVPTATDGVTTLTGGSTGDNVFHIPNSGTWTFTVGSTTYSYNFATEGEYVEFPGNFFILQRYFGDAVEYSYVINSSGHPVLTMTWTYTSGFSDVGIVFAIRDYTSITATWDSGGGQFGACTTTATLPTIVTAGTGRKRFSTTSGGTVSIGDSYIAFATVNGMTSGQTYTLSIELS